MMKCKIGARTLDRIQFDPWKLELGQSNCVQLWNNELTSERWMEDLLSFRQFRNETTGHKKC